jgi:hypothetical protein
MPRGNSRWIVGNLDRVTWAVFSARRSETKLHLNRRTETEKRSDQDPIFTRIRKRSYVTFPATNVPVLIFIVIRSPEPVSDIKALTECGGQKSKNPLN